MSSSRHSVRETGGRVGDGGTAEPAHGGLVLSNKTPSCFPETAGQSCKPCGRSMRRRQSFELRLHLEPKSCPMYTGPKNWDGTGPWTWTPEPFQKQRVHCPGMSTVDVPYHRWPSSKVLQSSLALPVLLHTCSWWTLKTRPKPWVREFELWALASWSSAGHHS